jgi:dihydroflavonol-4-reductase
MILVTGAGGHLGNVLVRKLAKRNQRVRAILLPGEGRTPLEDIPGIELVEADILDYGSLYSAFQGAQEIYHLASVISILPGKDSLLEAVNILGTRNIIHAARAHGVRRLIYTSSIHALRHVPHGTVIDENTPFDPLQAIGVYDRSKAQASVEVMQAAQNGLDAIIVCPTGIIGPYDYRRSEMGQLILDCVKCKPQLYIDGAYDFVDVRDVADGLILACEKGKPGESYILSGEQLTVRCLFDTIWKITGKRIPRIKIALSLAKLVAPLAASYYRLSRTKPRFTPYALEQLVSNSVISHEKASRELGYQPRSLKDSLFDTIQWFSESHRNPLNSIARINRISSSDHQPLPTPTFRAD